MKQAQLIWFTGLSGAGKSTLARALAVELKEKGFSVRQLDGDEVRRDYTSHLGFTPADIRENISVILRLCKEFETQFDFVLISAITPFQDLRDKASAMFGERYHEVFVSASLDKVIERDVKGLYRKALAGEIDNFIGVSQNVPYEIPKSPSVIVETASQNPETSLHHLLDYLENAGLVSRDA